MQSHRSNAVHILIVDDDPIAVDMLRSAIETFGYQVTSANSGEEALELMRSGMYRLVVSDWEMPGMDGLELCRQIRRRYSSSYVYVILLTVHRGTERIIDGLNAGADEFISKPFDPEELCVRIRAGERILSYGSHNVTFLSLAIIAESRDEETGAHVDRMREYCRVMAEYLSGEEKFRDEVDGDFVHLICMASPLHDIGKVGIPDRVLLKPGRITEENLEIMQQHTVMGGMMLDSVIYAHPEAGFLSMARDIARSHHERFDGSGYPDGLGGTAIPLAARIVSLADAYDELTTKHARQTGISHEEARRIIREGTGTHFDPDVVQAFLANEERFVEIHKQFAAREEKEARALLQVQPELSFSCL